MAHEGLNVDDRPLPSAFNERKHLIHLIIHSVRRGQQGLKGNTEQEGNSELMPPVTEEETELRLRVRGLVSTSAPPLEQDLQRE